MKLQTKNKSIGIVGGGLLGMTLALRLAENGFKVSLLERDTKTGGLSSSVKIGDYTWDRFYHVILLSDLHLISLLDRLSLKNNLHWKETKTGFFTDGNFYSMSNVLDFMRFPPLRLTDKFRLGWTIFYASKIKSWQKLEEITVTDWLKSLSGKRTFEKIWLPLLKCKLGENYKYVSASFIWAIIARMYAARRSGLKKEMFGYVEGGYNAILDRFQCYLDEIGVKTLTQVHLSKIIDTKAGVQLETLSGDSLQFDKVILTIPTTKIPEICQQLSKEEKERFQKITYQGVVCAALVLKHSLAEYYVTNITDEWVPFTAVIEMTSIVDNKKFDGNSLVYLPLYLTEDDAFWLKEDKAIENEFLTVLEKMYPSFSRSDVLSFSISKAKYVLPVATLNYTKELLPQTKTSLKNVFVVNSSQINNGTMNVNEVVGLANQKAEELVNILSA